MTIKLIPLSIVILFALAGCGGGGGGPSGGTIPINPGGDPVVNTAPAITSISPSGTTTQPFRILTDGKQHFTAAATDADGDSITWTWSATAGNIIGNGAEADYTAPSSPASDVITVTANDGHGHQVTAKSYLTVYTSGGTEPPTPTTNQPPVISNLIANPSSVDVSGTSTVTVTATDPDGDPLTYSWSSDGGTIQSQSGNSAVWQAPATAGSATVTVSVSDGVNPAVTKGVAISIGGIVQPPLTSGLQATYIQNSGVNAHPDLSDGKVVFTRVDPNINFDWDRKAPDPRLITNITTGNGHDWGIIWRGYIKAEAPGVYAFHAFYDDGFRLWISDDQNNMQMVIDGWFTGPTLTTPLGGTINLQGGKWYKFEAQMFQDEDRSYCQLYWQPPGASSFTIVPTDVLRTQ